MSNEELEALARHVGVLSAIVSELSAEQHAYGAAFSGLLRFIRDVPELRSNVVRAIEEAYATQLAESTNEVATAAFERVRLRFLEALGESPPADSTAPPGVG